MFRIRIGLIQIWKGTTANPGADPDPGFKPYQNSVCLLEENLNSVSVLLPMTEVFNKCCTVYLRIYQILKLYR